MKNLFYLLIFSLLASCATGQWKSRSGDTCDLKQDINFCESFAASRYPVYICRNLIPCEQDELGKAAQSLSQNAAAFKNCMYKKDIITANIDLTILTNMV